MPRAHCRAEARDRLRRCGRGSMLHARRSPAAGTGRRKLRRGEALRIETPEGPAAVALVAWSLADPSERLNYADTIKIQWTAALGKGRVLFSDMGRVMLSIVEDSCGAHDAIAGGSTPASVLKAGGNAPRRNTRDNFYLAAGKHGLSRRDVPPCISFFAPVEDRCRGRLVWNAPSRQAGRLRRSARRDGPARRPVELPASARSGSGRAARRRGHAIQVAPRRARRSLPHRDRRSRARLREHRCPSAACASHEPLLGKRHSRPCQGAFRPPRPGAGALVGPRAPRRDDPHRRSRRPAGGRYAVLQAPTTSASAIPRRTRSATRARPMSPPARR